MRNPILEESSEVFLRTPQYVRLHLIYVGALILFTALLWPTRGFMVFFRTETVPAVFQAVVIFQLLLSAGMSIYIGLDRLAEAQIIKYSEWIERTALPIRVLAVGKVASAILHSLLLVALGFPMVVIAAGPSGIPFAAIMASETVVLLTVFVCRLAGLLISHIGEARYFTRVTGGWLFVALLFIATVRIAPMLNPVVSVIAQHGESSPLMLPDAGLTFWNHPLSAPTIAFGFLLIALTTVYVASLYQHRRRFQRERGLAH
jgi:hypothetical protein